MGFKEDRMAQGKNDMERIGLFQEMTYITIGDRYRSLGAVTFNDSAGKGKQMLPGGSKERSTGLQAGYFNEKFNRVFEGESYSDPIRLKRIFRMKESKKNLGKPFMPTNAEKTMNGLGTFYGTIGGGVTAFSPLSTRSKQATIPGKNMYTNPGKKGTGYGYINVTIGPYPPNVTDPYDRSRMMAQKENQGHKKLLKGGPFQLNMHPQDYFNGNPYILTKPLPPMRKTGTSSGPKNVTPFKPSSPGKKLGGGKHGSFDPYPSHSVDPFGVKIKRPVNVVNNTGKIYVPPTGPKSRPVNSIVDQNITRSINIQNYRAMTVM
ncbi:UPF0602 protein C4orf47 homolog isoform X2 [Pomacea canaliculata]|uniref:UPF0602 protein C4orf47 homolog isoform X2 n=1 Tax=Pomacea canaliculata TaxID=400727 RepID=UPI000D73D576|nr:UPF0602 protein C4orf47 homolog isoform X2 [Pomacea canaliculata]